MERATGLLVFLQLFHTRQADFFSKSFLFHRPCHIMNFALSLTANSVAVFELIILLSCYAVCHIYIPCMDCK